MGDTNTKPKLRLIDLQGDYAAIVRQGLITMNRAAGSARTDEERQEAADRLARARAVLEGKE